jgi:hypothetical protein
MYVTGGKPASLDPTKPEDLGIAIQLEATVILDDSDGLYLQYKAGLRRD